MERLGNLLQLDDEVRNSFSTYDMWRRACRTIGQSFASMDSLSVLVATTSRWYKGRSESPIPHDSYRCTSQATISIRSMVAVWNS